MQKNIQVVEKLDSDIRKINKSYEQGKDVFVYGKIELNFNEMLIIIIKAEFQRNFNNNNMVR
jgi:hypothetical protein